ncbi:MAG: hypothetical protein VX252_02715, partial [Myxococcota bacterium]|nr:hypothetical protein [Myxococcota bacterium]
MRGGYRLGLQWICAWVMLLSLWPMNAVAGGRVVLLSLGDLGEFGEGVDAAIEAELQRRGLVSVPEIEGAGLSQAGVFPREVRRIAFQHESDAVVIGQGEPRIDGEGVEYSLSVYS